MSTSFGDAGFTFANGDTQAYATVPVRQTVLSGGVDSNGFASFGGSTGAATVTASTTLIATAANGASNRTGSITNPSWTGLSTNGTMYLGLTINADGTCTPFSTTLAPVYQWGGTYSTTSGQRTFNIQEMTMKVGNGSTAAQSYDVFVGEVTVAGAVVTAITWYALMGRYDSGYTATLPGTGRTSKNHNIGIVPLVAEFWAINTTTDSGYAVGDVIKPTPQATAPLMSSIPVTRLTVSAVGGTSAWAVLNASTGSGSNLTSANWSWKLVAQRGW